MGNSSSKDTSRSQRADAARQPGSPISPTFPRMLSSSGDSSSGDAARAFRNIIAGTQDFDPETPARRKETKQEKEARKLEKERVARLAERERSLRDEHVDGGYLVTLGTYVGPEDFSKPMVRQLQIERRLAPFWRGLNDHSDSWTEHQLVAAARGLKIPAPDEVPQEEPSPPQTKDGEQQKTTGTAAIPITTRSLSDSNASATLSSSHPTNLTATGSGASPLFRNRAKTLASLASSSKNNSQTEITPHEAMLPHEPQINGQPVEAYLYKDVLECPICFMYYPPYLNKTRCCDQPICSECFVQIKRPDPHPPEHTDPNTQPPEGQNLVTEGQLISEPAQCPFCVQPEFGVTYDAPQFRRGLVYPHLLGPSSFKPHSPASSSSSLPTSANGTPTTTRRRTTSLSANAPTVITTDKVRPDWAKKLSDARAHAARRAAAATALHTAAYTIGPAQASAFGLGRRRRLHLVDNSENSGGGEPLHFTNMEALLAAIEGESSRGNRRGLGNSDLFPTRFSSRAPPRGEDLEEMMMMEAIRQSLMAEEERKKREEKEAAKQAKKDEKNEKKQAKEQKKVDRQTKKGSLGSIVLGGDNVESGPVSPAMDSPAMDSPSLDAPATDSNTEEGKGKGRASDLPVSNAALVGFNPLDEPTSTLNTEAASSKAPVPENPKAEENSSKPSNSSTLSPPGISFTASDDERDPFEDPDNEYNSNYNSTRPSIDVPSRDEEALYGDDRPGGSANGGTSSSGRNLSKVSTDDSNPYDAKHFGDVSFLDSSARVGG